MSIQKLRLQRGWSQQQLAEASGLSSRTIQRLEAGQPPSVESLKSIAAVFEVDFSTLAPGPDMKHDETSTSEREEAEAFLHVAKLRGFYIHLARYLLVVSVLAVVNYLASPRYPWVLWVIFGWGIGMLGHASSVFRPGLWLGPRWERAQVEKRLGRPLQ